MGVSPATQQCHETTLAQFSARDKHRAQLFEPVWKDLIPQVFADVPRYYDRGNAFASLGLCAWWSAKFANDVQLPQRAMVLDVCSGTHDVARRICSRDNSASIYAVDRSPEMIEEGQRLAAGMGMKINAAIADAHNLPYDDGVFDVATLQFATRHLRFVDVFAEVYRILKPGGIFYHCDMLRPGWNLLEPLYRSYLQVSLHATAAWFGSRKQSRQCINYFVDSIRHYLTPNEMSDLMRAVGFVDVRQRTFLTGVLSTHVACKPG